ncbi:hypothetical protein P2H44_23935 [Albimonas sp. CAU 1670]|uniref:hypothetical protein n=1 Tax=Albimonas sp. CAU 1670 TaxID=3032599 RepID=UPI0023DA9A4C|nr:hypothetical protein [Albimonas sp. CAU 1670]MDF2235619.1 hypothetical protein [Albimonas sp. CAU 1670]
MRRALTALLCLVALPAFAEGLGPAGILSGKNKQDLPPITLSAGMPLADAPLTLKSGTYYEIEITADGSAELGLVGPEFFRAIWIDEIVIEGLEIRPLGLDSVEFDEAGTMEIGFLAIKPGRYTLHVPGSTGDLMRLEVTIE